MELCIGSPFFPGIEITYIVWDPSLYNKQPFRINPDLEAGDITKYMAIPWQADFLACSDDWWPTARPDDVVPKESVLANAKIHKPWARKADDTDFDDYPDMVSEWSKLGFIKSMEINGETLFVETERSYKSSQPNNN